jgi:nucleotide-binding universal stress UspA family protein
MIEKILVQLDGSEVSEAVLPYAQELGRRLNSEIILLNVYPPNLANLSHEHEVYLEHIAQTVKKETKGKVKSVVLAGQANRVIVDYSMNEGIGLIVGMSRSKDNTKKWVIGSTADKVIRETSKPVLVISAEAPPIQKSSKILNKVLVPLDGSHASQAILPYVKMITSEMSEDAEPEVTLLRVISSAHHIPVGEAVVTVPYTDAEMSQLKEQAENYLSEVGTELQNGVIKLNCTVIIRSISTADHILDFAIQKDINLIAMSTHGRTGISRLFLGATTDRILHSIKVPLLLVKPTED